MSQRSVSIKERAANKIKRTYTKYKKHKQTRAAVRSSAAIKIISFFKKYRKQHSRKRSSSRDRCSSVPIQLTGKNLTMELNKDGVQIPLFKLFNLDSGNDIIDTDFFSTYCQLFIPYIMYFVVIIEPVTLADETRSFKITCKKGFYNKKEFVENEEAVYSFVHSYILPYFYYIVANCGVVFEVDNLYYFEFQNPREIVDVLSGIHKDNTLYTCLTYVSSPVTTEIAFDTEEIGLPWLSCSPIFRFNTKGKLITLCMSDNYIIHTSPIYELNDKDEVLEDVSSLNNFDGSYMQSTAEVIVFGDIVTDSQGNPAKKVTHTFLRPSSRRPIKRLGDRQVMTCFIFKATDVFDANNHFKVTVEVVSEFNKPFGEIMGYKINDDTEAIILSKETVKHICTEKSINEFGMIGGRRSTRRRA